LRLNHEDQIQEVRSNAEFLQVQKETQPIVLARLDDIENTASLNLDHHIAKAVFLADSDDDELEEFG
jgi:hypothetical protein